MRKPPKAERKLRRALERETPIAAVVKSVQGARLADWANHDRQSIKAQAERIGAVRTLKLDEQAKSHTPSQGAVVAGAAIWNEHTIIEEDKAGYLIPRQSLTSKLYLRLFKPVMHFRDETFKVLDQASRDKLADIYKQVRRAHPDNRQAYAERMMSTFKPVFVTGSNPRLAWKSDQTLLVTRKIESLDTVLRSIKRVTSKTKETEYQDSESVDFPTWDASQASE